MPVAPAAAGSSRSGRRSESPGVLSAAEALSVLLVRAVEENDPDGHVLGLQDRLRATGEVRTLAEPDPARVIAARARALVPVIAARIPALAAAARDVRVPQWTGVGLVAVAGVIGVASSALGPSRRINVLSVPILLVLGWNLVVYLLLLASLAIRRRRASARGASAPSAASDRLLMWVAERAARLRGAFADGTTAVARAATAAYLAGWRRVAAPRHPRARPGVLAPRVSRARGGHDRRHVRPRHRLRVPRDMGEHVPRARARSTRSWSPSSGPPPPCWASPCRMPRRWR